MPPTVSGYKYVQSFTDGPTRLKYVYLLNNKSDYGGTLRDFIVKLEHEHECLMKAAHADNAAHSLVVISTAACVSKALSSPALHRTRQSRTDWRKISTKSCLLAHGAF
jgi:hypothetical protein